MELFNGSSSSTTSYQQEVEPGNLLEECWFFGNLLISSNPKMSRCNSDPCPSTNYDALSANCTDLASNAKAAVSVSLSNNDNHDNNNNKYVSPKLVRAPSLPTSFMTAKTVRQSGSHDSGEEVIKYNKIKPQAPPPRQYSLVRAPSLPPCTGREEDEDEEEDQESEFKLGRLIRQASLNSSGTLPPRQTLKSANIPRRSRKKVLVDGNKLELGSQYQINQTKRGKLPIDVQKKEVLERSKSLTSKFDKQSLEDEVSMYKAAGSQEKNLSDHQLEGKKVGRPYNNYTSADASAWHMTTSPTIPKWAAAAPIAENDKSSSQDMKAQLKFWARAVASNARAPGVL